jgi:cytochrome c peroxidase
MTPATARVVLTSIIAALGAIAIASTGTRAQSAQSAQNTLSALPLRAADPPDNPSTPEKVALGRLLFWDPVLSGAGDIACATCHHPRFGYSDGADLPIGTGGHGMGRARQFVGDGPATLVKRNSPTVLNAAFNGLAEAASYDPASAPMFWDSRVRSLEAQALEPLKAVDEMRGDMHGGDAAVAAAVARVAAIPEYRELFGRAFGTDTVTALSLARAIATFERSLVSADSPFDRYMRGDRNALRPAQVQGMQAFQDAGCAACHSGPMFSDYKLHVLGVRDNTKLTASDAGAGDTYAFRTPTLRNLGDTGPYMHSGVARTLDDVLNFYNTRRGRGGPGGRGGRGGPGGQVGPGGPGVQGGPGGRGGRGLTNPNVTPAQLDPLLRRVNVRNLRGEIVEFLQALNSDFDRTVPGHVPSGLKPGGATD